ncbi:MAG: LPS export ABC transporter periplasmic protein LptC [Bacteroidales bacterium]|nr:LPS export ABC transporter periplasmic protein LptC [Bacteroidales bacterium]
MNYLNKIVFGSIIIFLMMLFSCENDIKTIEMVTQRTKIANLSGKDVHILYSDSAKIVVDIRTKEINRYSNSEEPYVEFNQGLLAVFFSSYPDTTSYLRGNYAINYENKKMWEVKGNVIAKNKQGEVLNTEFLVWDENKKLIYSDKTVKITTSEDIIFGEGFESDETFSNWKIRKVTGTIMLKENNNEESSNNNEVSNHSK